MISFQHGIISLTRDGRRKLFIETKIENNDRVVLLGSNGSGKSTFLDIIAGIRTLDSGEFILDPRHSPISYVVQDTTSSLLPWKTLLSNILLPAKLSKTSLDEYKNIALNYLNSFNLKERANDFPYKLSGGEKQIINILRAICTPSKLVLLDEPFSPLNAESRNVAKDLIYKHIFNMTALIVTHDPEDLDWEFTKFLKIVENSVREISKSEAIRFLNNEK